MKRFLILATALAASAAGAATWTGRALPAGQATLCVYDLPPGRIGYAFALGFTCPRALPDSHPAMREVRR